MGQQIKYRMRLHLLPVDRQGGGNLWSIATGTRATTAPGWRDRVTSDRPCLAGTRGAAEASQAALLSAAIMVRDL